MKDEELCGLQFERESVLCLRDRVWWNVAIIRSQLRSQYLEPSTESAPEMLVLQPQWGLVWTVWPLKCGWKSRVLF
jgi:hypothetical protein